MSHAEHEAREQESGKEQGEPKAFELDVNGEFAGFAKVEVTKRDETKPWKPGLEVSVTKADGSVVEGLAASTPFFTFKARSEGGKDLTVSAEAAGHIDSLHIKGGDAGSRFDYADIGELMADAKDKIPADVATSPGVSAFDVEMGRMMGREGIAGMDELLASGAISQEDIDAAMAAKDEVYELNKGGAPEAKQAFVERFKTEHPDAKVQFQLVRGTVLVPIVDAPKRPTTKLFMVFGPDASGDKKTLYTMAPGRNMPRHPNPGQHADKEGRLDEKTFKESSDAWFSTVMLTGK